MSRSDREEDIEDKILEDEPITTALQDVFHIHGLRIQDDGLVKWTTNSHGHPRTWTIRRKLYDTATIVLIEGLMTLFSNVGTVSAEYAYNEFGITRVQAIAAFTTSYLVAAAFGGLFLAPFTETFGRRPSYILSCVTYTICCIIVAAPRSLAGVIIGRIGSGFFSAMGATVAVGSLEDMWDVHERIWVVWLWVAAAVLALGIGPVLSTYVCTSRLRWPWLYYIAAIVFAVLTALSWGLQESRSARRISNKMSTLLKTHGQCSLCTPQDLHCEGAQERPTIRIFLSEYLARPISLLFTEPIIFATTVMIAVTYATVYLLPEGITEAYMPLGLNDRQSSLVNLTISIGAVLSILPRAIDRHVSRKQQRQHVDEAMIPESKLIGFYLAAPALAVATWWWSWTLPPHFGASSISPFASMPALIFVGYATTEFDYVLSGYITDSYGEFASSANAPLGFVRSVLSGVFPLFGQQMFVNLGSDIAGTTLAVIATAFCGIAVLFWKYGKILREKSRLASELA